jgi:hypothetical protein
MVKKLGAERLKALLGEGESRRHVGGNWLPLRLLRRGEVLPGEGRGPSPGRGMLPGLSWRRDVELPGRRWGAGRF